MAKVKQLKWEELKFQLQSYHWKTSSVVLPLCLPARYNSFGFAKANFFSIVLQHRNQKLSIVIKNKTETLPLEDPFVLRPSLTPNQATEARALGSFQ